MHTTIHALNGSRRLLATRAQVLHTDGGWHFGLFVQRLANERGVTARHLAEAAGCQMPMIAKQLMVSECIMPGPVAMKVLECLHSAKRISDGDLADYLGGVGVEAEGEASSPTVYGVILKALRTSRRMSRFELAVLSCLTEEHVIACEILGPSTPGISERLLHGLHQWQPLSANQLEVYMEAAKLEKLERPLQGVLPDVPLARPRMVELEGEGGAA